jgi:hypothetical protein
MVSLRSVLVRFLVLDEVDRFPSCALADVSRHTWARIWPELAATESQQPATS